MSSSRPRRSLRTSLPLLLLVGAAACSAGPDPSAGSATSAAPPASGPASEPPSTSPTTPTGPVASPPSTPDAGATNTPPAPPTKDAGVDAAPAAPDASLPGWTLSWSDEFDLADGSPIDAKAWNQETGNAGFGYNQELEYYTSGTENAVVKGGSLVITAQTTGASKYKCQYGTCKYTSARFNTQGKFEQAYGRFEARIQIPRGDGLWPAFWMLGNDISDVSWPECGEIDVMENIGKEPATNHGSLHGPGYSGGNPLTASTSIQNGALADDFHVYAVEWAPNVVKFFLDDTLYETR
ncbi:MAG TPA: glycoside hydrolase family 16 protein, partial [Polyangiaceae bacterium]